MNDHPADTVKLATGYLASLLLVPVYVNMFPVWQSLSSTMPEAMLHLLPAAAAALTVMLFLGLTHAAVADRPGRNSRLPLLIGVGLCCIALVIPEPHLPAKRAHVVEYLTLSLLVRATMATRLHGLPLLVCATGFTAVLGLHDEFLQGFHPLRTYGLSDMTVNALAAFGGGLIWHSRGLFEKAAPPLDHQQPASPALVGWYLLWLSLAVLALVIPAAWYRNWVVPLWTAAPLLGTAAGWLLWRRHFPASWRHGITALCLAIVALAVYPALSHGELFIFF